MFNSEAKLPGFKYLPLWTWSKSLNSSLLQFPHLENGGDNTYLNR